MHQARWRIGLGHHPPSLHVVVEWKINAPKSGNRHQGSAQPSKIAPPSFLFHDFRKGLSQGRGGHVEVPPDLQPGSDQIEGSTNHAGERPTPHASNQGGPQIHGISWWKALGSGGFSFRRFEFVVVLFGRRVRGLGSHKTGRGSSYLRRALGDQGSHCCASGGADGRVKRSTTDLVVDR